MGACGGLGLEFGWFSGSGLKVVQDGLAVKSLHGDRVPWSLHDSGFRHAAGSALGEQSRQGLVQSLGCVVWGLKV